MVIMFAFMLSSCMATPSIHVKSEDTAMELKQSAPVGASAGISPDGRYFLIGGWKEESFRIWDISRGVLAKKIETAGRNIFGVPIQIFVAFTPDGKHVLSTGKELKLWNLSTGQEVKTLRDAETSGKIVFNSDGSKVLSLRKKTALGDRRIVFWDASTGDEIREFKHRFSYSLPQGGALALSPDGRHALSGHKSGGKMILWDVSTGEAIKQFKASDKGLLDMNMVSSVAFSPDGRHALSGGMDGTIRLWELSSGDEQLRLKGHTRFPGVMSVAFSNDGKYILSGGSDGLVKLWDISSGAEVRTYRASFGGFTTSGVYAFFSPDGKYIISVGGDASIRVFNASTGEEIAVMIGFEGGEWLVVTSEGYYNASDKGAQYLKVKFAGKDYTVDQFYDVFYRPDIVAAKLSGQDISGLISITMKDASKSPPLMIDIIPLKETNTPKVNVCYQVKSTGGGIGEVRLFHNGKLIQSDGYYREVAKAKAEKTQLASLNSKTIYEDMRSVAIKGTIDSVPLTSKSKGAVFEDCREVEAIPGENEVSVTAFNSSNTVQSYMKTVSFNSKLKQEEPHLYILAIGIDQYKDAGVNLKYAVKDARDIEERIKVQAATLYNPRNIHYEVLTDREATKVNITNKIDALAKAMKPQDSFILFVAGHGVLLQNQYYLLTHDYNGMVSSHSLISSNEIVEASKKIKSLSQLFIFDTCHAGGVDTIISGLYDARMSVLAKKMGLHIYASASDKQEALDGYKGNGLFTYTLLDGLNNNREADKYKDGKVSIVGLGEYSKKMTTNISKEIGHSQAPLIINFGKDSPIYKLQ